jgi:predicted lipoprotein with Yx(FWY)xxD motif
MKHTLIALSVTAIAAFSACSGGGGGGTNAYGAPVAPPVMSTPAPLSSPATAQFTTPSRGTQSGFAAANGFAVYDFDLDLTTPGTSACTGTCTTFWPPIAVPAGATVAAPFGTIRRPDGSLQLAFNGHPLYTFAQDTNATTASGDGLNVSGGVWHLAQAASLTTVLAPGPTSTPASPAPTPSYP